MTFAIEMPGIRNELTRNEGGYFVVWPKFRGKNVVLTTVTPTVGAAAVVDVPEAPAEPEYSSVTVVMTSGDCPDLGEDFPLLLTCTTANGDVFTHTCTYDVVRNPIGLLVSLNNMRERRPDILRIVTRLGVMLGETGSPVLPADVCTIYAASARVEFQDKLRATARGLGATRPSLILDRDRLRRVETALAITHVYEAIAKDPAAGMDEDSAQARSWRAQYQRAWEEMGPLAVDLDQDGATDDNKATPTAGVIRTTRVSPEDRRVNIITHGPRR